MGNKIANRQVICEVLTEHAKEDKEIVVLCSDSRGSASLAPFFKEFPDCLVSFDLVHHGMKRRQIPLFSAFGNLFVKISEPMDPIQIKTVAGMTACRIVGMKTCRNISFGIHDYTR